MSRLAERLQHAWYHGHPLLSVLTPLEWLYRQQVQRRRERFLSGQTPSCKVPVPLIVVGNITVGGTGKTPLILWLIEQLRARGLRVGVVSRGYGATPPSLPWRVLPGQPAAHCGDEPLLIVERTGVPLMVDPDRARAAQALLATEVLDVILSDDGLQHYRLARDLELVLIDGSRGLGNRRCLPAGPLREPVERLQSVDAVLVNGTAEDSADGYGFALKPVALVRLSDAAELPLTHFPAGQAIHAVAGIGNPQRFFTTLERLNWRPLPHPFADHASYSPDLLQFSPDLPLVMTEKDAVKCRSFASPDWFYLKVQAEPSTAFVGWFDQQLDRLLSNR